MEFGLTLYWQEKVFDFFVVISLVLSMLSFIGFTNIEYIHTVDLVTRVYVCLFLLWRFNSFRKQSQFTHFDRKIAFTAGALLLTTTVLNSIAIMLKSRTRGIFPIIELDEVLELMK